MRWELKKTLSISAAHELGIGECAKLHGHNWKITVRCSSRELNKNGMVIDFNKIKKIVMEYDHTHLEEHDPFCCGIEQTAENLARTICERIEFCDSVTVEETENNEVTYYR